MAVKFNKIGRSVIRLENMYFEGLNAIKKSKNMFGFFCLGIFCYYFFGSEEFF